MDIYTCSFDTRLGLITVKATDEYLTGVSIGSNNAALTEQNPNELCREAYVQIREYLSGRRQTFDLPVELSGSDFQNAVWKQAMEIPYGHIITYGQLAKLIGQPDAYRAVGNALHKNPLLLIVPCHRVNGTNGRLLGFAAGIQIKKYLQEFELSHISPQTALTY